MADIEDWKRALDNEFGHRDFQMLDRKRKLMRFQWFAEGIMDAISYERESVQAVVEAAELIEKWGSHPSTCIIENHPGFQEGCPFQSLCRHHRNEHRIIGPYECIAQIALETYKRSKQAVEQLEAKNV